MHGWKIDTEFQVKHEQFKAAKSRQYSLLWPSNGLRGILQNRVLAGLDLQRDHPRHDTHEMARGSIGRFEGQLKHEKPDPCMSFTGAFSMDVPIACLSTTHEDIDFSYSNWPSWVGPQSLFNRTFCGVVCVVILPFWHFCWCRGFCHRTGSDILLFVLSVLLSHFYQQFQGKRRFHKPGLEEMRMRRGKGDNAH